MEVSLLNDCGYIINANKIFQPGDDLNKEIKNSNDLTSLEECLVGLIIFILFRFLSFFLSFFLSMYIYIYILYISFGYLCCMYSMFFIILI